MSDVNTEIKQLEVASLDDILGSPGAENIIVPSSDQKKPSFFSKEKVDVNFVNDPPAPPAPIIPAAGAPANPPAGALKTQADDDAEKAAKAKLKETEAGTLSDVLDELEPEADDDDNDSTKAKTAGRPKTDKSALIETTKRMIKEGLLVPFDDDKDIDTYTEKDVEELFKANLADKERVAREAVPVEFFDSLPEELQVAAKYHADGGKDLKGLFRVLSEVEETLELDPKNEAHQEKIVREYLRATNFGNEEDIQEEINGWKDREELDKKAEKFKPKLDGLQQQRVGQKLAAQEHMRNQQAQAAKTYVNTVYKTLEPAELNGIKLDKRTQGMLYTGLVQPNYPSISGKPTNLLGHLLEKYQYVEPNHGLIAEALWLLADPDGYKSKLKEVGATAEVKETVRQLKTAEGDKKASTVIEKDEVKQRRLPRNDNFFKR